MDIRLLSDVAGVILVGGRSRRMGRDKALIPLGGKPLVERVIDAFRPLFERTLLVGDRGERFASYGLPVFPDIHPGSALGGLYTGLVRAGTPHVFVSACDVPWPDPRVIARLCSLREGFDVVVPRTVGGSEPLFAVYGTGCLPAMERMLREGNYRIYDFYPEVRTRYVEQAELADLVTPARTFVNVNTPEEFETIRNKEEGMAIKAVSFVAKSGTGKTTLLEKVIAELKGRGYRIGVIKHDAHRFDIDHPGKDSHRLTAAGADTMLIASPEKLALVKKYDEAPSLDDLLATYFGDVDIVLTEGFKKSGLPKIEVHRMERSATLLCRGEEHDPTLVAVASDAALALDVPVFDLNNPAQLADFVERTFLAAGAA
ncbi:bifunctional molybdenum cofactor guanylyltransferase MobA/molybdopterin-guanine dinucleotide biosynthesis adaptor protein MobB [Geobacter grbiciae]|uniref:bifunctional molybdenum cofactor guanylyltransferase MobA/molybdopterin-guanine dinucleotide biosynthesis adaptor protein MobB n=1 Tax=Geobacter grbiciae TaxID=155042 RepID=UPI001C01D257|nr:bifunctional molybdenum cofactor guanylyltransferase MobA/molybdopterin-guanine dinucleotide biosynthesis adaptor protein MobB [Geobacter grbiciae]MBT1076341.1 bifunctional molybdenum cofactor guanylyltransferase MobA/molybdopterin-guanine dinucleotide biosynthesis adaptor protein MobB [Geobacter grbiciae]